MNPAELYRKCYFNAILVIKVNIEDHIYTWNQCLRWISVKQKESNHKCQKGRITSLSLAYVLCMSSATHVDGWVTVTRVAVTGILIGYLPSDWLEDRPPGATWAVEVDLSWNRKKVSFLMSVSDSIISCTMEQHICKIQFACICKYSICKCRCVVCGRERGYGGVGEAC